MFLKMMNGLTHWENYAGGGHRDGIMNGSHMMPPFSGMGYGGIAIMIILWILALVGVALLIKLIIDQERTPRRGQRNRTAIEILDERYARGEIDGEEYEKRKKRLLH